MSTTLIGPEVETPPDLDEGHGGFAGPGPDGDGDRGGGPDPHFEPYNTAVWVLMIPIVMLFIGLTSSLVVRKGMSDDWVSIQIPNILVMNTLLLIGSSLTLEIARRGMRTANRKRFRTWLWVTAALGMLFLAGQIEAWRQLAAQGVFLASNPSSSFFYVLTATHGAHLLGGVAALIYLTIRLLRNEFSRRRQSALNATAVYWHFVDGLWIYLLSLLIFWR